MAGTRAAARLLLSDEQRAELVAMANSPSLPHRVVRQAKGLLDAADGMANEEIGRRCGVSANTVRAWRQAFIQRGVAGVGVVAKGRGRRPWLPEGKVAEVVRVTWTRRPRPRCSVSTRKPRSRRWTGPSPACPWSAAGPGR